MAGSKARSTFFAAFGPAACKMLAAPTLGINVEKTTGAAAKLHRNGLRTTA